MKASVNILHHQDIDWLRELDFYKGELAILTKRLEEVINANTHTNVTSKVEHFQNKFIVLKEVIDTLAHEVKGREATLERAAEKNPTHTNEHSKTLNSNLLNKMKNLAIDISDTRFDLNRFLAEVL